MLITQMQTAVHLQRRFAPPKKFGLLAATQVSNIAEIFLQTA